MTRAASLVPVPYAIQQRIDALGSCTQATKKLRISKSTYEDLVVYGALVRPELLKSVVERLEAAS